MIQRPQPRFPLQPRARAGEARPSAWTCSATCGASSSGSRQLRQVVHLRRGAEAAHHDRHRLHTGRLGEEPPARRPRVVPHVSTTTISADHVTLRRPPLPLVGYPVARLRTRAPLPGEHNTEIYTELKLSSGEITASSPQESSDAETISIFSRQCLLQAISNLCASVPPY